jgi:DNA (cytosine-5)-methyltransferase 1
MHQSIRFIDLFCGIGGFRLGAKIACNQRNITPLYVFSSDIDPDAQVAYKANFDEIPVGDITTHIPLVTEEKNN